MRQRPRRKAEKDTNVKTGRGGDPWVDIRDEQSEEENEWLGSLCAPPTLPLSTRRK
jgi:hypothetical protein